MFARIKKSISCTLVVAMLLCFAPMGSVIAAGTETVGITAYDYLNFPGVVHGTEMNSDREYQSGGEGFSSLWVDAASKFDQSSPTLGGSRTIRKISDENFYVPTANGAVLYREMTTPFNLNTDGVYYYKFRAANTATNTANAFNAQFFIGNNITISIENPANDLPDGISAAGAYPNLTVGNTKVWANENIGTAVKSFLVEITVNSEGDDTVRVQYANNDAALSLSEDAYQLEITTELAGTEATYVGVKSIRYGTASLGALELHSYTADDIVALKNIEGTPDEAAIDTAIAVLDKIGAGFVFDNYKSALVTYIANNNLNDDYKAALVSTSVQEDEIVAAQAINAIELEFTHSVDDSAVFTLTDSEGDVLEIEPEYDGNNVSVKLKENLAPNMTYTLTGTDIYDFLGLEVDDVELSFGTDFVPGINITQGSEIESGTVLIWEDLEGVTTTAKLNGEEILNGGALIGTGEAVLEIKAVNAENQERILTINFTLVDAFAPVASDVKIIADGNTLTGSFEFSDANDDEKGECEFAWYYTDKKGNIISAISGAETDTYTITAADYNKYIAFAVTPVALTGANNVGETVLSEPFTAPANPIAKENSVKLQGNVRIDETVEIKFNYYDENGDEEGEHIYKWYVCDTLTSEPVEIPSTIETNEKTYIVTEDVIGKYFVASVQPVSDAEPYQGNTYYTERVLGPVAPLVKNVKITGKANVGNTLTGTYDFFDENLDEEKGSVLEWINTETNEVVGTGRTLTLTSAMEGDTIAFRVKGKSIFKPYDAEVVQSSNVTVSRSGGGGGSGGSGGGFTMTGNLSGSEKPVKEETPEKPTIPESKAFGDVSGHWAQVEIETLYEKGIVSGTGEGNFEPNRRVTRAEIIKMLLSAAEIEINEFTGTFDDVKSDDWFAGYVQTALDKGLISEDLRFRPNDAVTRQETAKLLCVLMQYEISGNMLEYRDADSISDWAVPYVVAVTENGLMQGDVNNEFGARGNLTRAEAATVIYRILNK